VVLVAEDDRAMRTLLVQVFQRDGFGVVPVSNGGELLGYLGRLLVNEHLRPPDVIVCDDRMPRFCGLEVLSGLRNTGVLPPVVLITAFGSDETRARALSLGAAAYFDKPVDLDVLRRTVAELAERGNQGESRAEAQTPSPHQCTAPRYSQTPVSARRRGRARTTG
jgi:DNA-binding response OmpR family regulator